MISTYVGKLHSTKKSATGVGEVVDNQNVVLHQSLEPFGNGNGAIFHTLKTATVDGVSLIFTMQTIKNMHVLVVYNSYLIVLYCFHCFCCCLPFTEQLCCFGF